MRSSGSSSSLPSSSSSSPSSLLDAQPPPLVGQDVPEKAAEAGAGGLARGGSGEGAVRWRLNILPRPPAEAVYPSTVHAGLLQSDILVSHPALIKTEVDSLRTRSDT